ncbi:MAG: hypothetical protein M5U28_56705 [Sandaracinaceae bacterium]|nr:hypothetical protein [Sandaracinaceae bacterium]
MRWMGVWPPSSSSGIWFSFQSSYAKVMPRYCTASRRRSEPARPVVRSCSSDQSIKRAKCSMASG